MPKKFGVYECSEDEPEDEHPHRRRWRSHVRNVPPLTISESKRLTFSL